MGKKISPTGNNKSGTDNAMCFIKVIYSCNNLPKKESLFSAGMGFTDDNDDDDVIIVNEEASE